MVTIIKLRQIKVYYTKHISLSSLSSWEHDFFGERLQHDHASGKWCLGDHERDLEYNLNNYIL